MTPFSSPNSHHLAAAQGWLELGDYLSANEELEKIEPGLRVHPDVLEVRWQIYAKEKKWDVCVDIAGALVAKAPERPFGWVHRSFALHELKQTQLASDLLEPAADLFTDVWIIRYNLACYASRLGKHDEAWEWLTDAFDLTDDENAVKLMALDDDDLEPFWAEIGEI